MFIGAYFCLTSLVYVFTLVILFATQQGNTAVSILRRQILYLSLQSLLLSGAGLIIFISLSLWAGLFRFGVPGFHHIPHDYINAGHTGWGAMAVGLVGILSPLILFLWTKYKQ